MFSHFFDCQVLEDSRQLLSSPIKMLSSILRQNEQNQVNRNWYHDVKFDFSQQQIKKEDTPSFELQVPINEHDLTSTTHESHHQHHHNFSIYEHEAYHLHQNLMNQRNLHFIHQVHEQGYCTRNGFENEHVIHHDINQLYHQTSDGTEFGFLPIQNDFDHMHGQHLDDYEQIHNENVFGHATNQSTSDCSVKSKDNFSDDDTLIDVVGVDENNPFPYGQLYEGGTIPYPGHEFHHRHDDYMYGQPNDEFCSGTEDELISRDEAIALKRGRKKGYPKVKKSKSSTFKKKIEEPVDVAFPDGFERVLEKANSTSYTDVANERRRDDPDYDALKKRDCRRCETKVMLQSADGTLFNKFFEEDDIREFAKKFKILRSEYGFSQADVGAALGRRYGSDFSQTTISRFEGLVLSHTNMCKLRPPIESWLNDIKSALENDVPLEELRRACKRGEFWPLEVAKEEPASLVPPLRKRRKRTSLEAGQKMALEAFFIKNQRPDNIQMNEIAGSLDLDFDVVRVWFCNRRQKIRKIKKPKTEIDDDHDDDDDDDLEDDFMTSISSKRSKGNLLTRIAPSEDDFGIENEEKYADVLARENKLRSKKNKKNHDE